MQSTLARDTLKLASTAGLLVLAAILPVLVPAMDILALGNGLRETSITEFVQEALVTLTSATFFLVARRNPELRQGAILMGAFFLCLALREMDFLFDKIFHGAWKWLVLPIVATCAWTAWRNPRQSWAGIVHMLSGSAGTLLLAGTVLLVIYSRLIGMGALWESLLSDGYVRTAKNFVEEGSELMAYGVITVAALVRLAQSWDSVPEEEAESKPVRAR